MLLQSVSSALLLATLFVRTASLDNGVARTPPRGYTTWELFNFNVNSSALRALADSMVRLNLSGAGYNITWLDDGWPSCEKWAHGENGTSRCLTPTPRAEDGSIIPDPLKFPGGIKQTFDYIHSLGLQVGIYTAPHAQTCGGYTGSLNHEAIDAQTFASWGVDAVKLDAGCQDDCSLHDGCITASLTRMRDGLNATGRSMIYYVDDGNPTSGPRIYNPFSRSIPNNTFTNTHIARTFAESVVSWGPGIAHMYKLCAWKFGGGTEPWGVILNPPSASPSHTHTHPYTHPLPHTFAPPPGFDRNDHWQSLMDNVQAQVGMQWFQGAGHFLAPDQMTVGQGGMSVAEYRAEIYLYAVLGAPMFLSCSPAALEGSTELLALVTNPEVLAVNSDSDAIMGTRVTSAMVYGGADRWAFDVYVKPLSDASLVYVVVNRDPVTPRNVSFAWGQQGGDGTGLDDAFPAVLGKGSVRDLGGRVEVGVFATQSPEFTVGPHDAMIFKVTGVA